MGAWGALIMSFFGAVFISLTLYWQFHLIGLVLPLPFLGFGLIGLAAAMVIRSPGHPLKPTPREERAIMWSSIGEGIGLLVISNIVINLHHPDLLLPAMALVVGLHFLPIAAAGGFRPFYILGGALIAVSIYGFITHNGAVAGFAAAACLWIASLAAIRRDAKARLTSLTA